MINKQSSGIGHTLSASACFRIQAHQNMQSLLGFDSRINKHRWALLKCIRLSAHYRFIKFVLDVASFIVLNVSEIEFTHELKEGGPTIEVWH
jgi:hypothetical protein